MADNQKFIMGLLITFLITAVIGGILAMILSVILTPLAAGELGAVMMFGTLLIFWILLLVIARKKILKLNWVRVLIVLVGVGFIGSLVTAFIPALAPFILSIDITNIVTGLGWTIAYIIAAELIAERLGFK